MRAVDAHGDSEERYRALIEVSPQMVWMTPPDGMTIFVNQWWYDYTGLTQPEIEGFEPIHPEHRRRMWASWRKAVASGTEWNEEAPLRRASDGQYRWHMLRGRPMRDADDRIVRWLGIAIDIHDRREAEEALRRREAYLAEAQRVSHTGSWALNLETRELVYVSDELCRIAGLDPAVDTPSAETLYRLTDPDQQHKVTDEFESTVRDQAGHAGERRVVLPDGTVRHIHYVWHPMVDAAGQTVELIGTVMDVTERKHAEEALRQAREALAHVTRVATVGEVSASIAHELNQPLAAISNNASACLSLLTHATPDVGELRAALADIVGDAERASAIIDRVRALAKRSVPERVPIRLTDLVRQVLALTAAEAATRHIRVRTDVPADLPPVHGDRVELQQVLLNLVVNAMDAMRDVPESERHLTIRGRLERDAGGEAVVAIGVTDRGPGLDPEQARRIFEAFYTTKPNGMGLGLAISRSIVEAHGGRLSMETTSEPGATFAIRLPVAAGSTLG